MKIQTNASGVRRLDHEDHDGEHQQRLVAESSAIGDYDDAMIRPGSSYLWVGDHHHLNREQVLVLVMHLNHWLTYGRLPNADWLEP